MTFIRHYGSVMSSLILALGFGLKAMGRNEAVSQVAYGLSALGLVLIALATVLGRRKEARNSGRPANSGPN